MFYYEDPPWPAGSANLCIKALTLDEDNVPVELTSFTAINEGINIRLNWTTATEINNQMFEVQRRTVSSNLTGEWTVIGYKEGNGTTTEPCNYFFVDNISGINATVLEYRLEQIDFNGRYTFSEVVTVENIAPNGFVLEQNYPNPFNPSTSIQYAIGGKQFVTLKVYDVLGNEVAVLVNEEQEAGTYKVEFDAHGLSSGIYFYKIVTDNFVQTRKMILLK
jgi:hypothetical protein